MDSFFNYTGSKIRSLNNILPRVIQGKELLIKNYCDNSLKSDALQNCKTSQNQQKIANSEITYIESFVGSAVIFFNVFNFFEKHIINDLNYKVIGIYDKVKNDYDNLQKEIKIIQDEYNHLDLKQSEKYFLKIRKSFNENYNPVYLMFLLNQCYGRMYIENSKQEFNTAFFRDKNKNFKVQDLKIYKDMLQKAKIYNKSYKDLDYLEYSLIYLDPPYCSSEISYQKETFSQEELFEFLDSLDNTKYKWLLSNSDTENIRKLYKNYNIQNVYLKRTLNIRNAYDTHEVLISNF